jgi:hypothetical protein
MKKKVYICASMDGDLASVLERVKAYVNYALKCGVAPVAPHFYLQAILPDKEVNAEIIRSAARSLLWDCDEMWVFGDEITETMASDQQFCKEFHIQTKRIRSLKVK